MFTHLHVHTEYSMLDGLSRLEDLVLRTKELGMDSLAITDHGGMYGAIDFYQIANRHGVKPIIGCEMYVAPDSRHERNSNNKSPFHMTVLSHNERGYDNLVKLVSKANLEGFYYKPRIDREILEQHSEGLIVLSGCPSGEIPRAIMQGDMDKARDAAAWYKELLDGRYFLELMSHGDVPDLPQINQGLMELHRQLDIPVVATNDSHYTNKKDAPLQDILICIQTNTNIEDEGRLRMAEDSYYLRSPQEMAALWAEVPDAITNSQRIAEMCELNLDFSRIRLPEYPVPGGISADEYLAQICHEALNSRIPIAGEAERARLDYELEVIRETHFPDYFLVVWDIAKFVHERDIFFAVRGSAAASLVLYCLGVTDVNPLTYSLVFERFLNVERKEMPDIDMDFQDDRREEVINYVVDKYGREHVAQIITFGTFGAKAAIRDVGRALAMPYGDVDRVARLVPNRLNITLEDALEQNPDMKEIYDADEGVAKLVDTAMGLEGLTRHTSTHAAAVLISQEPLDDIVPLQRPTRSADDGTGVAMTQYAMDPCAALGLLKMDFLGLANLSILARARDLIAETRGYNFALTDIPLDDGNTFDLLSRGDTVGVFQLEGGGMTRYIKELKPSSLSDVAAMIALYRPGPMEHISTFIDSKHGRVAPHYPHPALQDILEETYGVIVYQDQVLQIARTFAGYSLGQADIVRKAMGKKIPEIMAEEKQNFLEGALNQGYTRQMAEQIFALIEPFAGYAFNKAHSVSYGLISYWTAYLKSNFPAEYMVALLNSYKDNTDRVAGAVAECRRMNINVLPPSINGSEVNFSIDDGEQGASAIRFGLSAIKNVGEAAVAPLIETRKEMDGFRSIEQLCQNADLGGVGKKALESLIRAGAFDDFGDRSGMLEVIDRIVSLAQSEAHLRNSQQTSMFDMMGDSMPAELASIDIPDLNTSDAEKGQWEQELLGVSTSNNAMLNLLALHRESDDILMLSDLDADMVGRRVKVTGMVSDVTHRYTSDQKPFAIASLILMDGMLEVFIWDEKLQETEALWQDGNLVAVTGSVRQRDDQLSLSCFEAQEVILPEDTTHHANNGEDNSPEEREDADLVSAPSNGAPNNTPDDTPNNSENGTASYRKNPPPPESVPEQVSAAQNGGVGVAEAVTGYREDAPTDIAVTPPPQAEAALSSPDADADRDNDPEEDNDLQEENNDEVALPQSPVSGPAQGTNGHARQNGNGASSLPSSPMNANSSNANSSAQADEFHRLLLRIIEGEPERDKRMLYDVRSLLMEYRGDCEVTLEIATAGHIVEMEWPAVRVSSGTELVERLNSEVLGEFGEAQLVAAAAR